MIDIVRAVGVRGATFIGVVASMVNVPLLGVVLLCVSRNSECGTTSERFREGVTCDGRLCLRDLSGKLTRGETMFGDMSSFGGAYDSCDSRSGGLLEEVGVVITLALELRRDMLGGCTRVVLLDVACVSEALRSWGNREGVGESSGRILTGDRHRGLPGGDSGSGMAAASSRAMSSCSAAAALCAREASELGVSHSSMRKATVPKTFAETER